MEEWDIPAVRDARIPVLCLVNHQPDATHHVAVAAKSLQVNPVGDVLRDRRGGVPPPL
jgi:hypothetical protein